MKHLTKPFLIFLLLCLSAGSCKKDDDVETFDPDNSMVEYFRCKINGEPFQALSSFNCEGLLFDYYPEAALGVDEGYMVIRGRDCFEDSKIAVSVALRFWGFNPPFNPDSLCMLSPTFADSCSPIIFVREENGNLIDTDSLINGSVFFQKFDPRTSESLGTVKGTFQFTLRDTIENTNYQITDGEFRYRVQHTW